MTPLLALTLTILTPTTPLATINTTPTHTPITERNSMANPHTSYPTNHPIIRQGPPTAKDRIGMDASHPVPPPQRHGNTIVRDAPTTFTDTRTRP